MKANKPLLRGYFHQAMFFISLGACILLISKSVETVSTVSTSIYSLGLLLMFGVSALYHRINWNIEQRQLMKKLDHSAIYIMIAGTFTPVCLLALPPSQGVELLYIIWAIAAVGIIQSLFFVNLPKIMSASIYIVAGYMILPYTSELSKQFTTLQMSLLIGGGLIYTLGGLSYGLKRPTLNPRVFGYHEVFHTLVSIGAILHFGLVYTLV